MTYRKRKKKVKIMRGKHTHGWGSKKKRRGAGNRGGRGMAGTGKRGDAKKTLILKQHGKDYFGRKGFNRHGRFRKLIPINISELYRYESVNAGDSKETYVSLNLEGYKLLGKGTPDKSYRIRVSQATKKAIKKIESAGGSVEIIKIMNQNLTNVNEDKSSTGTSDSTIS